MPATHLSLHYHIIFSTKDRHPIIDQTWRNRLHSYLGGTVRSLDAIPESIGGTADHVHLLIGLRATHCLAEFLRRIKHRSSKWVHKTIEVENFSWQSEYGAFTVSVSQIEAVKTYIARQQEHHQKKTFEQEYLEILKRNGVEYNELYL